MKRKILSLILAISMLGAFMPVIASAVTSGTRGDNITWTLDDDGTLTISGTGEIASTAFCLSSAYKFVIIEDGITGIGTNAFYDCKNLESVVMADTVTSIGEGAFSGCSVLANIEIPENVTNIVCSAFDGTEYYQNEANWTDGILYIGNYLIQADEEKIPSECTVKNGTKFIADAAFGECNGLKSVEIPDSVISIGGSAFYWCFELENVIFGNNVRSIGKLAFEDCTKLTSIKLPNSVTSLGQAAFGGCSGLKEIVIPTGVTEIAYATFSDCESLTDVYYRGTEEEWNAILIDDNYNTYLTDAKIHYNFGKPIPTTTAEITKTETDETYDFVVNAKDKHENCYVYAAVYNDAGILVGINRVPLDTVENTNIFVNKNDNAQKAKVFILAETLQPIINLKEFILK